VAVRYVQVTLTGSTGVAVRCEKCEHRYYYKLVCKAFGRANLVPLANPEDSRRTATGRAKQKLKELLGSQIAPVPCPECGWYQRDMVPLLRTGHLPGLRKYGAAGLIAGGLLGVVGFVVAQAATGGAPVARQLGNARVLLGLALLGLGVLLAVAGVAAFLFRWFTSASNFSPNDPKGKSARIDLGRKLAITKEQYQELRKAAEA
jgi:hypothetical protein